MRWIIGIGLFLCSVISVDAANVCDPIFVTSCTSVNSSATGGGAHTSEYGTDSSYYNWLGIYSGQKASYTASLDGPINGAASPNHFAICGSSIAIVKVLRFGMDGTVATTAARVPVSLSQTKAQITGGTALSPAPLIVSRDTKMPISTVSLLNVYTTTPTTPLAIGTTGIKTNNRPITATFLVTDQIDLTEFDFGYVDEDYVESTPVILRGPTQCLVASFVGAATVPTFSFYVDWTEEYEFIRR